ncbi:acetylornithine aminotransferase, partial [Mycobacterium tuberculosis]|nr:acetylornithine aminotransferase [Mycobacterium tuberculosis]
GLSEARETAPQVVPKVAVVTPPTPTRLLDGTTLAAEDADIVVRVISMGQAHRAVPGTAAMCLAAAALVPDTIVNLILTRSERPPAGPDLRIGTRSGGVTAA